MKSWKESLFMDFSITVINFSTRILYSSINLLLVNLRHKPVSLVYLVCTQFSLELRKWNTKSLKNQNWFSPHSCARSWFEIEHKRATTIFIILVFPSSSSSDTQQFTWIFHKNFSFWNIYFCKYTNSYEHRNNLIQKKKNSLMNSTFTVSELQN